jgi:hypothetical protein
MGTWTHAREKIRRDLWRDDGDGTAGVGIPDATLDEAIHQACSISKASAAGATSNKSKRRPTRFHEPSGHADHFPRRELAGRPSRGQGAAISRWRRSTA